MSLWSHTRRELPLALLTGAVTAGTMEGRELGKAGLVPGLDSCASSWPEGPGPEPRRAVLHSAPLCPRPSFLTFDEAGPLETQDGAGNQLTILDHADGSRPLPGQTCGTRGGPSDKWHLGLDTAIS